MQKAGRDLSLLGEVHFPEQGKVPLLVSRLGERSGLGGYWGGSERVDKHGLALVAVAFETTDCALCAGRPFHVTLRLVNTQWHQQGGIN